MAGSPATDGRKLSCSVPFKSTADGVLICTPTVAGCVGVAVACNPMMAAVALTTNDTGALATPPATTLIEAVPGAVSRFAVAIAVNCVGLLTVVANAVPFHSATASLVNPAPVKVIVSGPLPVGAVAGTTWLITGPATASTANAAEVPPSVTTVTGYDPAFANSAAGTVTVS